VSSAPALRTFGHPAASSRSQTACGRHERYTRDTEERELLARYAETGDPIIREQLAERFMPLARRLASRYRAGPEPLDDLVQVASLGLVKAIDRFDPDRGNAFMTFAVPTIVGELRRHFRDTGWAVHVNRGLKERAASVESVIGELTGRLGRAPSVSEIACRVELSTEEVLEAIQAGNAHHALSMDSAESGGEHEDRPPMVETLGRDDPTYDTVEHVATIAPMVAELSERERTVLNLRFVEDLTQHEIAKRIGVSQMHVSRILRATLERLREHVPEPAET
jgi:RNA polymerase sigma-B factor